MLLQMQRVAILLLAALAAVSAQPFQPGQNLAPLGRSALLALRMHMRHHAILNSAAGIFEAAQILQDFLAFYYAALRSLADTGNLRTSDFGGPYNLSLLNVQEAEVKSKQPAANFSTLAILYWLQCSQPGHRDVNIIAQAVMHLVGGIAARGNYSDMDIINFLTNVECLEGMFDTYGAFGFGFIGKQLSQMLVFWCLTAWLAAYSAPLQSMKLAVSHNLQTSTCREVYAACLSQ